MALKIFILNGIAGVGKDTFATLLDQFIQTRHISSIDPIKRAARTLGWKGNKDDSARMLLCELKKCVNQYSSYIWDYLDGMVNSHRDLFSGSDGVLLIDVREPEEIEKAVERYGCKTILVERDILTRDYTNSADSSVYDYKHYDYVINNIGSIEDLRETAKEFAEKIKNETQKKVVAVDFDGTIAKTEYPRIISPIYETIALLNKLKEKGATIILWTCREGKELKEAVEWCKLNNVPIDLVNENDKSRIDFWGNNSRKISADLYIDDKAFGMWFDRRNEIDLINALFK